MLENSKAKLAKKNADMIVANNLKVAGAGFGTDTKMCIRDSRPGVMQKLPKEAGRAAEVIEFNPALEENNRYVEIMDCLLYTSRCV